MRKLILASMLLGILLIAALPAFASHQWHFISLTCDSTTRTVTLVAENEGGEEPGFWVEFYADEDWVDEYEFDDDEPPYPDAGTYSFSVSAPAFAVGVVVTAYSLDGNEDVLETTCAPSPTTAAASADCPIAKPASFVVRSIPAGALAFFKADASAYTGFNLPAGKTWYTSSDQDGFTQVWIACNASMVWVYTENVVP